MSRVAELREALKTTTDKLSEFINGNGIKIDGGNVEVKAEDAKAYKELYKQAQEIKGWLDMATFGVDVNKLMSGEGGSSGESAAVKAVYENAAMQNQLAHKTLGQVFTESEEFKEFQKSGGATMRTPFELQTYDVTRATRQGYGQKDVYGALAQTTIPLGVGTVVQFDPMVPRAQRPTRVRDLFPVAATGSNLIEFFKVTGFVEGADQRGNAQTVPERSSGTFALKPQSNLQFTSDNAPVRLIAHWEAIHRNVIQDVPQLMSTINNELLYGLSLVEDDQILNGDGTGENLKGLLKTEGTQIYTAGSNEIPSDSLRKAATMAVLANYAPTGYVLHPHDWERLELQKGTGDGQYMLTTNIAVGVNAQVWRQPVVETPAIQEKTFVTGAWGIGAQLYDRQQASVRIAEQHADFFLRNAVVVLCEERLALATKRPESFVIGTFF